MVTLLDVSLSIPYWSVDEVKLLLGLEVLNANPTGLLIC